MADNSNLTMETNQNQNQADISTTLPYLKILLRLSQDFCFPETLGAVTPRPEMQNLQLMDTFRERLLQSDDAEAKRYALMLRTDQAKCADVKQMSAYLNYADAAVRLHTAAREHQKRVNSLNELHELIGEVVAKIGSMEKLMVRPQQLQDLFPSGQAFLISRTEMLKDQDREVEGFIKQEQGRIDGEMLNLRGILLDCYRDRKDWPANGDPIRTFQSIDSYTELMNQAVKLSVTPGCRHGREYIVVEDLSFVKVDDFLDRMIGLTNDDILWGAIKKLLVEKGAMKCLNEVR